MTKKVQIRHVYDGLQDGVSDAAGLDCSVDGQGKTDQSQKADCDLNHIMKRWERTGALPDMIREDARYGDFSDVPSYEEALQIVAHANEQFAALDAHIRARFSNDPAEFLAFATDPANLPEMRKLGLAKEPEAPVPSEPAAPAPAAEAKK